MNIVVLVKQVPAVSDIEIDPKTNNLVRIGAPSMLNPVDFNAVEAALQVKEAVGGTVTLITMGTALAGEAMRDGIAIGADKGILVSDERMGGSDTLATGKILAKAIAAIGDVDLVFTGKQSADGDTGQIPPAVAQHLGMSLVSYADSVVVDGTTVKATRHNHGGIETVEAQLPAVCSVTELINTPRSPKIKGKMNAKKAIFDVWRLEDIQLDPAEAGKSGSATTVTTTFAPEKHAVGMMIEGSDTKDAVKKLVDTLASEKIL
ncbi:MULTISPECIES: electron transfer flavoprotein subunit beta/FixA family protein [Megasphaera]|uniref:Electron transfer flavoprotein small subunit n=1 Tax=Megasphaera vaginalis (ex Srinivasan et al. 2021) TaxID=1111454 RepID=U7USV3_9FIRM|nr:MULTISPECIES: electron transfer flavoprotein subunit beta/FixA family protein [Megasphaera]ERT61974.1 putative electron transfer flavoprotein subunit beta [Megasphaera vaginalis (ex Srinivasan et al. 2021)]